MLKFSLAAVAIAALAACSHGSASSSASASPGDIASPSDTASSITVQTNQGAVTIGKDADTSKIGAPQYPGAETNSGGSVAVQGGSASGEAMVTSKTSDSFDKVYGFYKQQLPANSEKSKTELPNVSQATFQFVTSDGLQTSVIVTGRANETDIIITHAKSTN